MPKLLTRRQSFRSGVFASILLLLTACRCYSQTTRPSWVLKSDEQTHLLLKPLAAFEPEAAGSLGVDGCDGNVVDLANGHAARWRAANASAVAELRRNLERETDPNVSLDLRILIDAAEREARGRQLAEKLELPHADVAAIVYDGVRSLLDDQIAPPRRQAALVRLRKYAGLEPGTEPLATLAEAETRAGLSDPSLLAPFKERVETELTQDARVIEELGPLFAKYKIDGYEPALEKVRQQVAEYDAFVRARVLPRARQDFRLPPELYAYRLEEAGVDMPPTELHARAAACFRETQSEMETLAPLVAKGQGFTATGYRDVIRELQKRQVSNDELASHFAGRIRAIEDIVRREGIVTLPDRPMRFRVASEAEAALAPAPHFNLPRLIDNAGEQGEFVLPLRLAQTDGAALTLDDYTWEAYTWTLTAHEGRPGHDLQFAALTERGVSLARAVYAENSVNVEGWALYAEAEMRPYLPLDGQLATLQARLLRCARAILDPGLQDGSVSRDDALRVLRNDVCLSQGAASLEVQRYTFRSPGQATAYFCGYQRLIELRADVERALGPKFDRRAYHDFVLAQGLLPPKLLREAVMRDFVGKR